MLIEICRLFLRVPVIVNIVKAVVVIAVIKEKKLLIVYQLVEQKISTNATQVTIKKIFALVPTK